MRWRSSRWKDLEKILALTLTGMSIEEFQCESEKKWIEKARDPRWSRPNRSSPTYLPMQEQLRANGYKTYIVTGGGQDFVRVYSEARMHFPPEQVIELLAARSTVTARTANRF